MSSTRAMLLMAIAERLVGSAVLLVSCSAGSEVNRNDVFRLLTFYSFFILYSHVYGWVTVSNKRGRWCVLGQSSSAGSERRTKQS